MEACSVLDTCMEKKTSKVFKIIFCIFCFLNVSNWIRKIRVYLGWILVLSLFLVSSLASCLAYLCLSVITYTMRIIPCYQTRYQTKANTCAWHVENNWKWAFTIIVVVISIILLKKGSYWPFWNQGHSWGRTAEEEIMAQSQECLVILTLFKDDQWAFWRS